MCSAYRFDYSPWRSAAEPTLFCIHVLLRPTQAAALHGGTLVLPDQLMSNISTTKRVHQHVRSGKL